MVKKVVIIGGEGNGGVIASCIEDNIKRYNDLEWEVVGFINDYETEVCGYPVIGKIADIPTILSTTDYYFMWAIHLVGRNYKTVELFNSVHIPESRFATIYHKSAFIGKGVELAPGAFVMANCYIGSYAKIGLCSLVMANCSIGHNTIMGPLCHCSVGSIMTGYSQLGYCSDLAIGSATLAYVKVGDYAMVGAKSLATKDIPEGQIFVGIPGKYLKDTRKD